MAARKRDSCKAENPAETARLQLLQEILEYLLPKSQAEQAVREMRGALGSLGNMLTAPETELVKISGMTPRAAHFLRLTADLARACLEEDAGKLKRIMDFHSAVEVLRPKFLGRKTEAVGVILLDSGRKLLYSGIISEGSINAVPLYVRQLVRMCIDYDAESVVLAHNHISGSVAPSPEDMVMTKQVEMALSGIDISLRDHIILSDGDEFSFLNSGILPKLASEVLEGRRVQLEAVRGKAREYAQTGRFPEE